MLRWENIYEQLKPEERATVMRMDRKGSSVRAMARALRRPSSTISRELLDIVRGKLMRSREPEPDPVRVDCNAGNNPSWTGYDLVWGGPALPSGGLVAQTNGRDDAAFFASER